MICVEDSHVTRKGPARQQRRVREENTLTKTLEGAEGLRSVPALLHRNATQFADAPAYREKEFGIWQSWTWSQALEEIEALALGMIDLGVAEGDFVAVIGRNRPRLYWAMISAQMCGAIPVPLYNDAAAEEMAYTMGHCGAKFVVAGDQEQVDKVMEIQDQLPQFEEMIYLDARGLAQYDHDQLGSYEQVPAQWSRPA